MAGGPTLFSNMLLWPIMDWSIFFIKLTRKVFHLRILNHFCNVDHTLKKQNKPVIWWICTLLVKKHQNGQTTPWNLLHRKFFKKFLFPFHISSSYGRYCCLHYHGSQHFFCNKLKGFRVIFDSFSRVPRGFNPRFSRVSGVLKLTFAS